MGKHNLLGLAAILGIALFGGCAGHYQKTAEAKHSIKTEERQQKPLMSMSQMFPGDKTYEEARMDSLYKKYPGLYASIYSLDMKIADRLGRNDSLFGIDPATIYDKPTYDMIIKEFSKIEEMAIGLNISIRDYEFLRNQMRQTYFGKKEK